MCIFVDYNWKICSSVFGWNQSYQLSRPPNLQNHNWRVWLCLFHGQPRMYMKMIGSKGTWQWLLRLRAMKSDQHSSWISVCTWVTYLPNWEVVMWYMSCASIYTVEFVNRGNLTLASDHHVVLQQMYLHVVLGPELAWYTLGCCQLCSTIKFRLPDCQHICYSSVLPMVTTSTYRCASRHIYQTFCAHCGNGSG